MAFQQSTPLAEDTMSYPKDADCDAVGAATWRRCVDAMMLRRWGRGLEAGSAGETTWNHGEIGFNFRQLFLRKLSLKTFKTRAEFRH
jgi:hypothetical protein